MFLGLRLEKPHDSGSKERSLGAKRTRKRPQDPDQKM